MPDQKNASLRTGRELFDATRPFADESRVRSWWYVVSTFVILLIALVCAAIAPQWPVRLVAAILGALLMVRTFVLYHDFVHGAILRGSRIGQFLFSVYGAIALTPPRSWRHSHNFHHAHVGKPVRPVKDRPPRLTSDVGSFPLMTTAMWRSASTWQRLRYRVSRHPLTILCAYGTVFLVTLCVVPVFRDPRKHWHGVPALAAHGGIIAVLWILAGFSVVFFAFLLPFAIGAALGAYLFFAQHNHEEMRIASMEEWTYDVASLESSTYLKLGPIMQWFTANIGYHHVHHVNSLIPFYRLPACMAAIPEFQHPVQTSLRPRDIAACFRWNLWDMQKGRLVGYHDPSARGN
jgi:omega-6 fatty acid desaturase (delta-12 desaturase)